MTRYTSSDGLLTSSDPNAVATWEAIGQKMARQQEAASARLRAMGVKLEHPDDGWVNREHDYLTPCYSQFDLRPQPGDLIALGWPQDGYRIVECTRVEEVGLFVRRTRYYFTPLVARVAS